MDEATKQAMNTFVQQMIAAAQNSAQWTADQAPLLVQEWLRWQLYSSVFWAVFGVGLISIGALVIRTSRSWYLAEEAENKTRHYSSDPLPYVAAGVVCGVAPLALGLVVAFVNLSMILKVIIAPRVVVLEKLMTLVK